MNLTDIIFISIGVIVILAGTLIKLTAIHEEEWEFLFGVIGIEIVALILLIICPFLVVDKAAGATIGEITSVDKNYYGTTAVYIKTSENTQEKYCIENEKVADDALFAVGHKVKVTYGTRVGFYSTGRCHEAPIKKIEIVEE